MPVEIAKPWTPAQNRLFRAAEHDPDIARRHGLSRNEARKLAEEGVKKDEKSSAKHPGGDTDKENDELATKTPKHAGGIGFVDLSPIFGGR